MSIRTKRPEELALIYHARGMDHGRGARVAGKMLKDPEHALNTLAREDSGLNPDDLGSPWGARFSRSCVHRRRHYPLEPFLLKLGPQSLLYAAEFAGVALFVVGTRSACSPGVAHSGRHAHAADRRASGAATYAIGTAARRESWLTPDPVQPAHNIVDRNPSEERAGPMTRAG